MAGPLIGRQVAFAWNAAAVLGVREKGVTFDGAPIDLTSDENSGWQTLSTLPGLNKVTISLSGVIKDRRLKDDWNAGTRTRTASLTYPDGTVVSGTFYLANYKEGTPYKDAVTFDAELQSSGAITYTPGS